MLKILVMHAKDNVGIVTAEVKAGTKLSLVALESTKELSALSDIPIYHKVALTDVAKGALLYKYGNVIGEAIVDIAAGAHVHTHNIKSVEK